MSSKNAHPNCLLCPRGCGVDREVSHNARGKSGFCGESWTLRLGFAGIHQGEEPPVTGHGGSGTIFLTGCNLGCVFCQNYQISREGMGREVSAEEFAEICLALEKKGAENINLVTGSHFALPLARGIEAAKQGGLKIPVVWNSSGYDGLDSLEILKDHIDLYLPDLKTLNPEMSARFFNAPDYPSRARAAILKMMEYREIKYSPDNKLISGVMVRHLVIPGDLDNTRQILAWLANNCFGGETSIGAENGPNNETPSTAESRSGAENGSNVESRSGRALLSLMTQYTPVYGSAGPEEGREIPGRYLSEGEYEAVLSMLDEFGIDQGFCQELVTGSDWLPDFNRPNPFSSKLSLPVWHWKYGFSD